MNDNKNIVIATGGTGGHIFPAASLANYFNKNGFNPIFFAMIQTLTIAHVQIPKRFHSAFVGIFCLLLPLRP